MQPKEPKKNSKFAEKYKDRVESIQNADSKIAENRRIPEEIEKMEKAKRETQSGRRMATREAQRREPMRRNQGKRSM